MKDCCGSLIGLPQIDGTCHPSFVGALWREPSLLVCVFCTPDGDGIFKGTFDMTKDIIFGTVFVCAALTVSSMRARAEDNTQQPATDNNQPAASPTPPPLLAPGMAGPLEANPKPMTYDLGPAGNIYITGVVSGLGLWQSNPFPGDRTIQADVSNAQAFVQKTDGLLQFFVQAGAYSLPALGVPYIRAGDAIDAFYGPLPQAFIKLAPTDNFSIVAGKLPTLIGAEYTFSFENMNIQRGLLWNQENAVNRGVQVNYIAEPFVFQVSWNDGFYSNVYSWLWGSVAYVVDEANSVSFIGGGNTRHTSVSTTATPLFQNNQQIYNLIYTHTAGPWTFQPYLQYTHVPSLPEFGAPGSASTWGAALLMKYNFGSDSTPAGWRVAGFNLPIRLEYISSTGSVANGAPNLLYGPGSNAWSITLTPTYQYKIFFARAEFSYVGAGNTTPGLAFGANGTNTSQTRGLLEVGLLF